MDGKLDLLSENCTIEIFYLNTDFFLYDISTIYNHFLNI